MTLALTWLLALGVAAAEGDARDQVVRSIESKRTTYGGVAMQIWSYAEVGYQEKPRLWR